MSDRWFKVVRPDLSSFADKSFRYRIGGVRRAPRPYGFELGSGKREPRTICKSGLLHASPSAPQAARYGRWPYRLLLVDPESEPYARQDDKAGFLRLRVIEERPVSECFGPSGELVLKVIRRCERITVEEAKKLAVAWDTVAAWNAAWAAARDAARATARDAAGYAAWAAARNAARDAAWVAARATAGYAARDAARDAAWVAATCHLIGTHSYTQEHYDTLMAPWVSVFGENWTDDDDTSA